jgi:hypothetical protein
VKKLWVGGRGRLRAGRRQRLRRFFNRHIRFRLIGHRVCRLRRIWCGAHCRSLTCNVLAPLGEEHGSSF